MPFLTAARPVNVMNLESNPKQRFGWKDGALKREVHGTVPQGEHFVSYSPGARFRPRRRRLHRR